MGILDRLMDAKVEEAYETSTSAEELNKKLIIADNYFYHGFGEQSPMPKWCDLSEAEKKQKEDEWNKFIKEK